jgi:DNA-binding transcriptional ArsR family regulator
MRAALEAVLDALAASVCGNQGCTRRRSDSLVLRCWTTGNRVIHFVGHFNRPHYLEQMKPIFHPAVEELTVEGILYALSDPLRVHIFAEIALAKYAQTCSAFLEVSDRVVPKSTLSQHFKVLREAGLIRSERSGVELHNSPRIDELDARFPGLIPAIIQAHKLQSQREKTRLRRKRASG